MHVKGFASTAVESSERLPIGMLLSEYGGVVYIVGVTRREE